jgi:prepilin-type N-terminal cleavage/methylation domain-containing protein
MRRVRHRAAALNRDERGFTLIELLVATAVGLVVVGGGLTIFMSGIRSDPRTASQVTAIQQARVTVDRITRELRQGLEIPESTPSRLAIVTYVKAATCGGAAASTAIPCRVTYTCSAGSCTRVVAQPNGTAPGPAVTVASGLASATVFEGDPTYVKVTFSFATDDGQPFVLEDGVALRNFEDEA